MPFVRFSRDKRGYEYIYLIHAPQSDGHGGSAARSHVLYWYRTPPGVRVGREPFDPPLRRALEAQNPDLTFDWKAILDAQAPPPPEAEPWRERRRAERSAKHARTAVRGEEPLAVPQRAIEIGGDEAHVVEEAPAPSEATSAAAGTGAAVSSPESGEPRRAEQPTGRRRRRGGRHRRGGDARTIPVGTDGQSTFSSDAVPAASLSPEMSDTASVAENQSDATPAGETDTPFRSS